MSHDVGRGHLQIGEVAARTELSIKTIRHYDEVGLVVPSARSTGGFRLYTADDVDRLLAIRRMKPLGFSLDEMRALLAAIDTLTTESAPEDECAQAIAYVGECHGRAREACEKLSRQLDYAHELTAQLAQYRG
ncbi:MerR family transcriptional regulator [Mycobacterium sp. 21AC1]|uniref:MerR family transcriptional regulator n=1 Tax=[Mycobacterium] appelbergii TaxID=2939269 RepID=UPI002938EE31|nr:MerR family transcriptional regulator [Mycobacterium sp. 21AC1]MDV3123395.1 MerR family transcriptional regulator [Mycobacterium sp. 21AC1]